MAKKFSELRAKMPIEAQQESERRFREMMEEIPLEQLRRARKLTQEQLAETLNLNQSSISKLEKRTDLYLSTLANFVAAMGGELEIRVVFPDKTMKLSGLRGTG